MRFFRKPREAERQEAGVQIPQYEVAEFALKHGVSIFESRRILRAAGESREKADEAAEVLKGANPDTARP